MIRLTAGAVTLVALSLIPAAAPPPPVIALSIDGSAVVADDRPVLRPAGLVTSRERIDWWTSAAAGALHVKYIRWRATPRPTP